MKIKYAMIIMFFSLLQPLSAQIIDEQPKPILHGPTLLWTNEFSGGGSGYHWVTDACMDHSLSTYITGESFESNQQFDIRIIKYDKNGDEKWNQQWDIYGFKDLSRVICQDAYYIYITGSTQYNGSSSTATNIVTIKCNKSNGEQMWLREYGGTRSGGHAIAVNQNGEIYVAGETSADCVLLKYDSAGNLLWTRTYDHGYIDFWYEIVLDEEDNIFVAGRVAKVLGPGFFDKDIAVAKYLPDGTLDAMFFYLPYDESGVESSSGIDRDVFGNIYVSGVTHLNSEYQHPVVFKFDNSLNLIWEYHYYDPSGNSCALGNIEVYRPTGESYITGWVWRGNYNALTIGLDADGNSLWIDEYGGSYDDQGKNLGVTKCCVYVSGYYGISSYTTDFLTLCYNRSTGRKWWEVTYDFGGSDKSYNVAVKVISPKPHIFTYIVAAGNRTAPHAFATLMYSHCVYNWLPQISHHSSVTQVAKPFCLKNVHPNPAKGVIRIRFSSPDERKVTVKLYDVTGRLVDMVFDGKANIGMNEISYTSKNISSGIYFVRLETEKKNITEKVLFQR